MSSSTPARKILIVDDEEAVCWSLQRALTRLGHLVQTAGTAEKALAEVGRQRPDVIVMDIRLPGMDGLTALARLRELASSVPVIIITAFGNLTTAVKALEGGAFDYLTKPFNLDQALATIARALDHQPSAVPGEGENEPAIEPEEIVGHSPAMQVVFKRIALVAPRDSCVLITGESGTGKELVARAIHRYSSRRDRPLLPVNVAALNPNLVESELFGHVKGAFTGATQARMGLLPLANQGTVFLDELAEISMPVQVKLLRVLEQNEVLPVGASQHQPVDVRILTATNQDLSRCVANGTFRQDLFFRLNVFQIHLPPLRERIEDIQPLAEHFLRRFDPRVLPLGEATLRHLQQQPWFGNVRELRNALEHAAILARGGALQPEHFPHGASSTGGSPAEQLEAAVRLWCNQRIREAGNGTPTDLYLDLLRQVEPPLLDEVLRRLQGNRWAAANWLGLNRATVRKKLALYNLHQTGEADSESVETE